MAIIVSFSRHKLHGRWCCDLPSADDPHECVVCFGGLSLCTVCGGAEASMPTDCPGKAMHADVSDAVQAGELDYTHKAAWHLTDRFIAEHGGAA